MTRKQEILCTAAIILSVLSMLALIALLHAIELGAVQTTFIEWLA